MTILSRLLAALLLLTPAASFGAGVGSVDPGYGENGQFNATGFLAVLPGGRLIYETPGGGYGRTDVNGQRDDGFGFEGTLAWPTGFMPSASLLTDGKLLVAGNCHSCGDVAALVLLDAYGHPDARGALPIPVARNPAWTARVESLARRPDGRILVLVAQYSYIYDVARSVLLFRLLPDLSLDKSFGSNGALMVHAPEFEVGSGRVFTRQDGGIEISLSASRALYFDPIGTPVDPPDPLSSRTDDMLVVHTWSDGSRLLVSDVLHFPYVETLRIAFVGPDGVVTQSFESDLSTVGLIEQASVSEDGAYLYLLHPVTSGTSYRTTLRRFILSGPGAGTFDGNFGEVGFPLGEYVREVRGLAGGAALVVEWPGAVFRLLGLPAPSGGIIGFLSRGSQNAWEVSGMTTLVVTRTHGADGAVSVAFRARAIVDGNQNATEGNDFAAVSGRLEWADGDSSDKTLSIGIRADGVSEPIESFVVELYDVSGAALYSDTVIVAIRDEDPGPAATAAPPGTAVAGGGGGAFDASALGLLAAALAIRRSRRSRLSS